MNRFLSLLIIISIIGCFTASSIMLGISSLNYPGGEALFRLHEIVWRNDLTKGTVSVHMDVLSCMTGVSRFQQDFPTPPLSYYFTPLALGPNITSYSPQKGVSPPVRFQYDKTEEPSTLLDPAFWTRFDYVLAEHPETVIGKWQIVDTIYGYSGIEILRPGAISSSGVDNSHEAEKVWEDMGGQADSSINVAEDGKAKNGKDMTFLQTFYEDVERLGFYGVMREGTRRWITKGWWVGPKMEAKIRILKRVPRLLNGVE
jgi:alpha-1,6-mannosyltransferase